MSLDVKTVGRIAHLARIEVEASELEPLAGELSHILGWIEQLNEVDTSEVEPLASVTAVTHALREDVVADGDRALEILMNAPERDLDTETGSGFFVVPKVVE